MRKKLAQIVRTATCFVTSLFLVSCFASCKTHWPMIRGHKNKGCTTTASSYWYVMEEKSIFLDSATGYKYEVTLESQINLNRKFISGRDRKRHNYFHARDVATMAHLIVETWKEKYGTYRIKEIQNGLSKFHIIVAKNRKEFNRIWNPKYKDSNAVAARMILAHGVCFGVPQGTNFIFVVMPFAFTKNNSRIPIHEMMHMVSFAVQGHVDTKHRDHRFWTRMGDGTMVPSVVRKYNLYKKTVEY